MSFDWLNVPGLDLGSGDQTEKRQSNGLGPPSVSFDFGINAAAPRDSSFWDQGSRSQSDTTLSYRNNNPKAGTNSATNVNSPLDGDPHAEVRLPGGDAYTETPEDMQVPLSLSQNQLTHEEIRTYLRWYNYICLRTRGKLVRLNDVFRFLTNFNLSQQIKERIVEIFRSCKNALNVGQFFAVLRLISRAIVHGILPLRRMILDKAPVPKPRPILSSENHEEVYEEVEDDDNTVRAGDRKVDFDSFASLLLTGTTARKRVRRRIKNSNFKSKKVRFSEHVAFQDPPNLNQESFDNNGAKKQIGGGENGYQDSSNDGPLDLTLPMDQLLKRLYKGRHNSGLVSSLPSEQQETEEEKKVLEDMKDSLSHFKQIQTVDSASLPMSSVLLQNGNNLATNNANSSGVPQQVPLEPLKPTATGSANHLVREEYNQGILSNSGATQTGLQPLKPTATGSANYLMRSHVDQPQTIQSTNMADAVGNSGGLQPLKPTATGSANYLMKQHLSPSANNTASSMFQQQFTNQSSSPQPTGQFMNSPNIIVSQDNQQQQSYHGVGSTHSKIEPSNISPQHTYSNNIRINNGNVMPMPKVEISSALSPQNTFPQHPQSHLLSPQNTISQHQQSHMVSPQSTFAQSQPTMISPQNTYPNNQPTMISPQHTYTNGQQQTQHLPPPPPPRIQQQQQHTSIVSPQNSYPNMLKQTNLAPTHNTYTNSPNIQSPSFLSPQNAANSYFQSLLSTSPSPNPTPPNAVTANNNNANNSISSFQPNMPSSNPAMSISQSHQTYNGNYPAINQRQQQSQAQQPMYGGQLSHMQQHPGQPHLSNPTMQNQPNKPNYGMLGHQVPQQQQFPFNTDVNRSNSSDILGNLQSLQQQVDALQVQYNRRP
ncbi:Scd5p [Saccharomyces cerevisiae x Saccharomyces kudriavzevii VIN7]|uniref:Scd5p n=1 Tax=Saccharomyces cerevisiae x Saccharomyces kudriavzevii (strain VIN7) TaxID=1095631 RepID=H0H1K2_SACCK|nr:Scd5p [Saccharomyces cerevisiae x Saccharomyces kudriavzevii VIN7]